MLYLKLPNTYYRCQLAEHKIRDFPLVTPRVKPAPKEVPIKQAEGKKVEWVTVGCKGKVTLNPFPPKQSYTVVAIVPPIPTGASVPASVGTQVASTMLVFHRLKQDQTGCLLLKMLNPSLYLGVPRRVITK